MSRYMILYNSDQQAIELMAKASPEQMRASMDEWMKWREDASKKLKVDFGLPLQPVTHLDQSGTASSPSQTAGYSMIEGSQDEVVALLKTHPHLARAGASIDVLEMLPMPGM